MVLCNNLTQFIKSIPCTEILLNEQLKHCKSLLFLPQSIIYHVKRIVQVCGHLSSKLKCKKYKHSQIPLPWLVAHRLLSCNVLWNFCSKLFTCTNTSNLCK